MIDLENFSLLRQLRCCFACGELGVTKKSQVLCVVCETKIADCQPIIERRKDWWSCSLLTWNTESEAVGRIIHSLKGSGSPSKFTYFAQLLTRKVFLHSTFKFELGDRLLVVPAPARDITKPDHAFLFASAMAQSLGAEMQLLLRRKSLEEQKGLGLVARKRTELYMQESEPSPRSSTHIFFVDDLIVSGGTAEAAYRALGGPKYFTVLTLATRPRLQNPLKVAINSDA